MVNGNWQSMRVKYTPLTPPSMDEMRETFKEELTPQDPPKSPCGWIAPDGRFFACEWAEHTPRALTICNYLSDPEIERSWKSWEGLRDGDGAKDFLIITMGWIAITVDTERRYNVSDFVLGKEAFLVTEAQRSTVEKVVKFTRTKVNPLKNFRTPGLSLSELGLL